MGNILKLAVYFYLTLVVLFAHSKCFVKITPRLMCDNTRALLLPSFSDCVPVKRPLKALPILGRLCI